jgi:hypothetical protein
LESEEVMPTFEDIGRKLDRELAKLRQIADEKFGPTKRTKTAAKTLRNVSERLSKLAEQLEAKSKPEAS